MLDLFVKFGRLYSINMQANRLRIPLYMQPEVYNYTSDATHPLNKKINKIKNRNIEILSNDVRG